MIADVDEALKGLIRRDALNGSGVEVVLDAPTKDWAARCTAPTVDLYLYDIREVAGRRSSGSRDVLDEDGHVVARRPSQRIFRLSYLLTAWTQRPEDEHRLLAAALGCFLRHDSIPVELCNGALEGGPHPPMVSIAQPTSQDRQISEIWSALGGELKPSLDLVVLASVDTGRIEQAAALVREIPRFRFADGAGREEESGGPGARGAGARGAGARRAGSGRRGAALAGVWTGDGQQEEVSGGKDAEPGRTLRAGGMPQR